MANEIVLNILKKKDRITDSAIAKVEAAYEKLLARLDEYTKSGGLKALDIALARQDVERMLLDSGAYEVVRQDTAYQAYLKNAQELYQETYGKKFSYNPVSINEMDAIRKKDFADFFSQTETSRDKIASVIFNNRVGAMSYKDAIAAIKDSVDGASRYAKTFVETAQTAFSRIANQNLAESAGIEKFEYVGPMDTITREFCAAHIGEVKTLEEWDELSNGQIDPVSIYAGGYRCRHMLIGNIDA
jgi:hypothetical protein